MTRLARTGCEISVSNRQISVPVGLCGPRPSMFEWARIANGFELMQQERWSVFRQTHEHQVNKNNRKQKKRQLHSDGAASLS